TSASFCQALELYEYSSPEELVTRMERPSTPPEIRLPSETSPSWAEGPVTPSRNGCAFSPDSAANATSEVDPAHETSLTSSQLAPTAIGVSDRLSPGVPALSRGTPTASILSGSPVWQPK